MEETSLSQVHTGHESYLFKSCAMLIFLLFHVVASFLDKETNKQMNKTKHCSTLQCGTKPA